MDISLAIIGICAESIAWWRVSTGASVWAWMTPTLACMGLASLIAGPPPWAPELDPALALLVGVATGIVLFVATKVFFLLVAPRWAMLRRHSEAMYARQGGLSLGIALALSIALSVPGEELFWRGFVQLRLGDALDSMALAAVLALVAFVIANAFSRNLAIVAGAAVGGAVWCALFAWTGGVAASLACHVVWTGLMIVRPVVRVPSEVPS